MKNGSKLKQLLWFSWSSRIFHKNHSKTGQNWKVCFDLHGLVGFLAKTIQKRVKIGLVGLPSRTIPWKTGQNWNSCFHLRGLVGFPSRTICSKTGENWRVCLDLRSLVGFLAKTIQERIKIEKVAPICVV